MSSCPTAAIFPDALVIWRAKMSSFDAACSIDVQLLCGSGLDDTKSYLSGEGSADTQAALSYLAGSETAGDLDGFSAHEYATWWNTEMPAERAYPLPVSISARIGASPA